MTGAEHYTRAERCLELAQSRADGGFVKLALAEAQAHATLALAAATAMGLGMPNADYEAWKAAAATPLQPMPAGVTL